MKTVHLCVIVLVLLCLPSLSLAEEGKWTRKADMPTPRWALSTSVVDGKIYAIGGASSGWPPGTYFPTVEVYDPMTDTWIEGTDMPTARAWLSTSVIDGKIYAIGGTGASGELTAVEEYNPKTETWTRKAPLPSRRTQISSSVVNGRIYVIGGSDEISGFPNTFEYDPLADTWTKKADMPAPRVGLGISVVNGKIYAIGGKSTTMGSVAFPSVFEYDPSADTWAKRADMPTARVHLATAEVNGKIYAIGGRVHATELSTVEVYDPQTDTWSKGENLPAGRSYLWASPVHGKIYAIGGFSIFTVASPTVEEYDTVMGIRVENISPQQGRVTGGEPLIISGSGFPPEAIITIGGEPLTHLTVTDTLVTGLTPPGIEGEQHITVVLPSIDYSSVIGKFLYNPLSDVAVTGITPASGKQAGGDAGSIVGSGFLPGATVTIGGVPAANVGVTSTLVTFTIPPGTEGAKDVVVTNPDGQKATLRGGYTYNPFPIIKEVEPLYGGPVSGGTEMTIIGSNFMEGVVVTIGEKKVQQLDFFSPTELRLRTPPGARGAKPVSVTNPDGQEAILEDGYTYNSAPTISSVSPSAGPLEGGTPITIIGTGFIAPGVLVGDAEASSVTWLLSERIVAETPPSDAGVKDVVVVNRDGQKATLRDAFIYNTAPVITRVTPDNGRLAGGTRITIQGGGFQPGAEVRISVNQGTYRAASSVEVMSSSIITALTPPGQPGAENVLVLNPDIQIAVLPEGFTYNHKPVITRLIPNHGPSSGGATITIEGSGFLLGARVVIGERPATTMVRDDMTIEAVAPPNPQGVWDVRVINPDTQEVVKPGGYVSVGEMVYNYPNPFHASRGTTFRYVTKDPVHSVTVKIFNMRGRPIGAARQIGSNEVKWVDPDVYAGLYIYILEAELEDGKRKQVRNVMEVIE